MFKSFRISFLVVIIFAVSCTNSYIGRYIVWNFPKANDYKNMPYTIIENTPSREFRFAKNIDETLFSNFNLIYNDRPFKGEFDKYLQLTGTNAFLVIRNDTIIYEKYYNNYTDSTISRSFSVSKSFLSALIGIAIDQHYIKSIDERISNYLPGLDSSIYNDVTIRSLLNMSSGLTSKQNFFPWSDLPKTYHSPNIRELTMNNLKKVRQADQHFEYNNYNTFLLGMILENATHTSISKFLEKNLWSQIGTSHSAFFSLDSKKNNFEKVETGISASATDFAKFGRLYLNNGVWNGKQIVPSNWVSISSSVDTTFLKNSNYYSSWMNKNCIAYRNAWWQKYDSEQNCFCYWASGFLGQLIWIHPQKKVIIVRLGNIKGRINWNMFLSKLIDEL